MRIPPSGAQTAVTVEQEHAKAAIMPGPRGSKRALAMVCGAGWSPATEPKKLRPGSSHAEAPQHNVRCAGPAVQLDAKAASKTAASGHEGPNVPLATPPRRPLAPPPNGPCSSATRAAETRLSPPKQQQQQWQRDLTSAVRPRRSPAGSPCPGQEAEQAVPAAEADQRDGLERAPPQAAAPWRRARKGACKGGGDRRGGGARVLQMFTLGPLSRAGNVLTVPYPQKGSDSVLTAF